MSLVAITDEFCAFCGLPGEIARVYFIGCGEAHTCIAEYQCPQGHDWEGELEEVE